MQFILTRKRDTRQICATSVCKLESIIQITCFAQLPNDSSLGASRSSLDSASLLVSETSTMWHVSAAMLNLTVVIVMYVTVCIYNIDIARKGKTFAIAGKPCWELPCPHTLEADEVEGEVLDDLEESPESWSCNHSGCQDPRCSASSWSNSQRWKQSANWLSQHVTIAFCRETLLLLGLSLPLPLLSVLVLPWISLLSAPSPSMLALLVLSKDLSRYLSLSVSGLEAVLRDWSASSSLQLLVQGRCNASISHRNDTKVPNICQAWPLSKTSELSSRHSNCKICIYICIYIYVNIHTYMSCIYIYI